MSRQTSNWVDRGDPVEEPLARILGGALSVEREDPRLPEIFRVLRTQVAASATEGEVASYVGTLFPQFVVPLPETPVLRLLGTALWHIAKVEVMRERARSTN